MALTHRTSSASFTGRKAFRAVASIAAPRPSSTPHAFMPEAMATISRRSALGAATFTIAGATLFASKRCMAAISGAAGTGDLQTAANGLAWRETVIGSGPAPVKGALIRCHYTGRLASNGRVFDSSYERGRPLTFKIGAGEVIKGWDLGILGSEAEGIPPMLEGGKRTLIIPAALGYGSRGAGGVIPPDAVLEFDVELLAKR